MPNAAQATTLLTIDLDKVVQNWRTLSGMVGSKVQVGGVVKADAYGLGAAQVAPALLRAGCKHFWVATLDEALALRPLLPQARLFVLGGIEAGAQADFVAHDVIPVLNSPDQIALWQAHARHLHRPLPAALHLDTGMCRLGLQPGSPPDLSGLDMVMVISHMACADDAPHPMNHDQLQRFKARAAHLAVTAPLSLAASSTIFLGAPYHFDHVRPGAALYGLNPQPGHANPMAQPITLSAKILQVRDVDTPQTVGYGASHRVGGPSRIATIGLGYADGLLRSLGNRGTGFVNGEQVPVVGRISMDLTTFDVGRLDRDMVRPGATIQIIGPDQTVDDLAAQADTIGYEILTGLSRRAHRVYVGGAA